MTAGVLALAVVAIMAIGGCAKLTESYNDAPVAKKNDAPAEVYSMPDGFSNVATKCDEHGNRIYVAFKGDDNRAAVAVVAQDPSCTVAK